MKSILDSQVTSEDPLIEFSLTESSIMKPDSISLEAKEVVLSAGDENDESSLVS